MRHYNNLITETANGRLNVIKSLSAERMYFSSDVVITERTAQSLTIYTLR